MLHCRRTDRRGRRHQLRRRDLLKAGIGAAAALAAPGIGGAAAANTLVVARAGDLVVLDPVVTFNRQTRNYAYLVFDTLYGLNTSWQAQPQMVEGHEVDDDGLTWLLRLRDGLRFHERAGIGKGRRGQHPSLCGARPVCQRLNGGHRRIVGG